MFAGHLPLIVTIENRERNNEKEAFIFYNVYIYLNRLIIDRQLARKAKIFGFACLC